MGQYYNCLVEKGKKVNNYGLQVKGKEYNPIKLMEHSWWGNEFMQTITGKLLGNKMRVAWVGDYCNDDKGYCGKLSRPELWKMAYDGISEEEIDGEPVSLGGLFLVNHTKKEYLDCDKYYKNCVDGDGWCIHPLSILTAACGGGGGGDYGGINGDLVGEWCFDEISVEKNTTNLKGFVEVEYQFKEEF